MRSQFGAVLVAATITATLCGHEHMAFAGQPPVQIGSVPIADAPLNLAVRRIHVQAEGSEIHFVVTSTATKKISTYTVTAYWYPPLGKRHGFASGEQHPASALSKDAVHEASLKLPKRAPIDVGTTVVVALTAAAFEDGTEWRPDSNRLTESVARTARELGAVEHP